MLTSAGGHPAFVRSTSRQCCSWLIRFSAGNQAAACESPNSTTEVEEVVSPYTHGLLLIPGCWRWQPFSTIVGSAFVAVASGGWRFDGTALVFAPAARSACSCVAVSCFAAFAGVSVRTRAAADFGAARLIIELDSTTTATAIAASIPPPARPRSGRRTTTWIRRIGRSNSTNDITAITSESSATASASDSDKACPRTAGASTSAGQCHRYQE